MDGVVGKVEETGAGGLAMVMVEVGLVGIFAGVMTLDEDC